MQPPPPGQPIEWMPRPQPIPGVPIGLEYFTQIDGLQIEQKKSLLEVLSGYEAGNKYVIRNTAGQQCFYAVEETSFCMRACCGSKRGFTFIVLDNMMQQVMRFTREFKCCAGCSWCAGCCNCCAFEVKVEAPIGQVIGYIKQGGSFWKANYKILDEYQEKILELDGPCCIFDGALNPCDNEFKLMTANKDQQIGSVKKVYAGFITEALSLADQFTIDFPMDLSVKCKASLMGALFLIVNIFIIYL